MLINALLALEKHLSLMYPQELILLTLSLNFKLLNCYYQNTFNQQ